MTIDKRAFLWDNVTEGQALFIINKIPFAELTDNTDKLWWTANEATLSFENGRADRLGKTVFSKTDLSFFDLC